jgi:hypothetical protein
VEFADKPAKGRTKGRSKAKATKQRHSCMQWPALR